MSRAAFEIRVARLWELIPPSYREQTDNLVLMVEDWADEETLRQTAVEDPRDLLGFYLGCPLPERSYDLSGEMPDQIFLYRGAIENHVHETAEPLDKVIFETLVHELAHHLGFSEEDLDPFERLWAEGGEP